MGWGDDIMTTGIVKRAYAKHHKQICVGDGKIRWSPIFDGNPKIATRIAPDSLWVRSFEGRRPYIDYVNSTPSHYAWNYGFRAEPGEIYLRSEEREPYRKWMGRVYIEPNSKTDITTNRDWGFDNWQKVVDAMPEVRFVQGSGRRLRAVEQVDTPSFRDACALLSHCSAFVGTDGGMHHAAAALGKRAVVLWGGFAPPAVLGYSMHTNICKATKWCGTRAACEHCESTFNAIAIDEVISSIYECCL